MNVVPSSDLLRNVSLSAAAAVNVLLELLPPGEFVAQRLTIAQAPLMTGELALFDDPPRWQFNFWLTRSGVQGVVGGLIVDETAQVDPARSLLVEGTGA